MPFTLNKNMSNQVADETYTQVNLYVRDTSFSAEDALIYDVQSLYHLDNDTIIKSNIDGVGKGLRMIVLSNHAEPALKEDNTTSTNSFILKKGDHFKVIANSTYQGKGVVVFLHLPKLGWEDFFADTSMVDSLLINFSLREFEVQSTYKPRPEDNEAVYTKAEDPIFVKEEKEEEPESI